MVGDAARITSQVLSGWKEIANYLGKGVRTVQRYEREMHLPARRPSGTKRGSVIATREDLDHWVATCPMQHERALKGLKSREQLEQLKKQIRERRKLCAQMAELRGNVGLALISLSENVLRVSAKQDHEPPRVGANPSAVDPASIGVRPPGPMGQEIELISRGRSSARGIQDVGDPIP